MIVLIFVVEDDDSSSRTVIFVVWRRAGELFSFALFKTGSLLTGHFKSEDFS